MGWSYAELLALPAAVYDVLVQQLNADEAARVTRDE